MKVRNDIPCVSQTAEWKGFFEAHYMSGDEIDKKYPVLDHRWKYITGGFTPVKDTGVGVYGYYIAYVKDFDETNGQYSDPWYRRLKCDKPVYSSKDESIYLTTIESNAVALRFIKNKL